MGQATSTGGVFPERCTIIWSETWHRDTNGTVEDAMQLRSQSNGKAGTPPRSREVMDAVMWRLVWSTTGPWQTLGFLLSRAAPADCSQ